MRSTTVSLLFPLMNQDNQALTREDHFGTGRREQ
jgi:hypothetical protein